MTICTVKKMYTSSMNTVTALGKKMCIILELHTFILFTTISRSLSYSQQKNSAARQLTTSCTTKKKTRLIRTQSAAMSNYSKDLCQPTQTENAFILCMNTLSY